MLANIQLEYKCMYKRNMRYRRWYKVILFEMRNKINFRGGYDFLCSCREADNCQVAGRLLPAVTLQFTGMQ
jgi:hypothetical protein